MVWMQCNKPSYFQIVQVPIFLHFGVSYTGHIDDNTVIQNCFNQNAVGTETFRMRHHTTYLYIEIKLSKPTPPH